MLNFKLFIELTRINKPIGFMLLFWPCLWGLTVAYDFSTGLEKYIFYLILFLSGSILMRSAGCIVNDITDKNFDKLLKEQKIDQLHLEKFQLNKQVFLLLYCA